MRHSRAFQSLLVAVVLFVPALPAAAQTTVVPKPPVVPKPTLPEPTGHWATYPTGFPVQNKGRLHKTLQYPSTTLMHQVRVPFPPFVTWMIPMRPVVVYTHPGYSTEEAYPVLYLLHGRWGDQTDWTSKGNAKVILDILIYQKKIVPMIVVMPDNFDSLQKDVRTGQPESKETRDKVIAAYLLFEQELINDLIPWVEANFSTMPGRDFKVLAGLSMGGEQALKFGTAHLDTFSYIGAFSPGDSLTGGNVGELITAAPTLVNLPGWGIWMTCGNIDRSHLSVYDNLKDYLKWENLPSTFNILAGPNNDKGTHDWTVWKPSLYYFVQRYFSP